MSLIELLQDYQGLPEYCGLDIKNVDQRSLFGDFPLNIAASRGSISELQLLARNGALVNRPGEHGYTPLHNATEQGHLHAVIWLLSNGAERLIKNDFGETPLDLAKLLKEAEIHKVLSMPAGVSS